MTRLRCDTLTIVTGFQAIYRDIRFARQWMKRRGSSLPLFSSALSSQSLKACSAASEGSVTIRFQPWQLEHRQVPGTTGELIR
jgi:hypothetical protein